MFPVGGSGIGRYADRDIDLGGYLIPKGTEVAVCLHTMHMVPWNFPEPKRFSLDRWLQEAGAHILLLEPDAVHPIRVSSSNAWLQGIVIPLVPVIGQDGGVCCLRGAPLCAGPAPDAACSITIPASKATGGSSEAAHEHSSAAGWLLLPVSPACILCLNPAMLSFSHSA